MDPGGGTWPFSPSPKTTRPGGVYRDRRDESVGVGSYLKSGAVRAPGIRSGTRFHGTLRHFFPGVRPGLAGTQPQAGSRVQTRRVSVMTRIVVPSSSASGESGRNLVFVGGQGSGNPWFGSPLLTPRTTASSRYRGK